MIVTLPQPMSCHSPSFFFLSVGRDSFVRETNVDHDTAAAHGSPLTTFLIVFSRTWLVGMWDKHWSWHWQGLWVVTHNIKNFFSSNTWLIWTWDIQFVCICAYMWINLCTRICEWCTYNTCTNLAICAYSICAYTYERMRVLHIWYSHKFIHIVRKYSHL